MTKGERRRLGEFALGVAVAAIGLLTIVTTVVDQHQDAADDRRAERTDTAFRQCIVDQVKGIGSYLDSRSDTTVANNAIIARDRAATRRVIRSIGDAFTSNDLAAIGAAFRDYRIDQDQIKTDQKTVDDDRAKVELPPFPDGKCDPA